ETMESLYGILLAAEQSESREEALRKINEAFGKRVTNALLITSSAAAPAFLNAPSKEPASKPINKTMVSG
ncbi:hypothetical protein FKD13_12885, partial [Salmonella enterica]|nr:hypothetical protein [Salmonella enterica]